MARKQNPNPPRHDRTEKDPDRDRPYCIELKVPDVIDESSFIARSVRDLDDIRPDPARSVEQTLALLDGICADLQVLADAAVKANRPVKDRAEIAAGLRVCEDMRDACLRLLRFEDGHAES